MSTNFVFQKLDAEKILTLLAYGEARGEGIEGMLAVISVACNRARQAKKTIQEICLARKQFTCFKSDDPNYEVLQAIALDWDNQMLKNKYLRTAYWIAKGVLEGYLFSNVGDANHYHAEGSTPSWTKDMVRVKQIRKHIFYWKSGWGK